LATDEQSNNLTVIRRYRPKTFRPTGPRIIANSRITASEVRVISDEGTQVGVLSTREALQMAYEQEKDLVLVNDSQKPPIAKIIAISKYKYQVQQKEAQSRKNAKAQEIKEVRFTPFMSDGDYQSRLKKVLEFLDNGDKVRLSLMYKGRQITKQEFGQQMIAQVITDTEEVAVVEMPPKMLGRKLIAQLMPKKK